MGMSLHVKGFIPPDAEFNKAIKAYNACREANVPVPKELLHALGLESSDDDPDEAGGAVDLDGHRAVKEYRGDMKEGFDVDLRRLPPSVKILRFYYSC